jgi:2-methylaconitate cis-trans-isomerase PrpF
MPGSVAAGIARPPAGSPLVMSVEHPSGEFTVTLEIAGSGADFSVRRSGLMRTARALMSGEVLVPATVWEGSEGRPTV